MLGINDTGERPLDDVPPDSDEIVAAMTNLNDNGRSLFKKS